VELDAAAAPSVVLLDRDASNLYAGSRSGELAWWRLGSGPPAAPRIAAGSSAVTALTLLIGDRALVVGREDGSLEIRLEVRRAGGARELALVRSFPAHPAAIRALAPSWRDKGFLAQSADGTLGLYYSTSERVLWRAASPATETAAIFYAPKADGALLLAPGRLVALDVDNPHPEVSLGALFGRVWYEGFAEPDFVWQSSGGSDDFEPKLSLTPLLAGTLKGTAYSLLLAIPLAVLGALYTAHFMHPRLKSYVKPAVEIMAALPSVVLGFLAGLWLAPRVERMIPALVLMAVVLPLLVLAAGYLWRLVPRSFVDRFPVGSEAALYLAVLTAGIALCIGLNDAAGRALFGGSFSAWLLESTGLVYDQRNAVVVGLAMGFAVIPIIFSIAEDAFSNVPRNLVSASLALGANRWQTATRVVLPTASPGIFSAIMIGFGRAVGETMIVLMAAGNTPLLDWNPFNGFRTLSANIAVEIPEAPHGGTLYRTLFLAALLLFVFTFLINTAADLVRQRLRRRYSEV
jgi:phosphate transport system permease protein